MGFSGGNQGHQGNQSHDDNEEEEDDNEVENNNKDDDNNKDENDDMGISALWLDRDVGFLWGHQGRQGQWSHDDEEEDEVEDNNIEHDNNKDDIYFAWKCLNLKGICQLKNLENFS